LKKAKAELVLSVLSYKLKHVINIPRVKMLLNTLRPSFVQGKFLSNLFTAFLPQGLSEAGFFTACFVEWAILRACSMLVSLMRSNWKSRRVITGKLYGLGPKQHDGSNLRPSRFSITANRIFAIPWSENSRLATKAVSLLIKPRLASREGGSSDQVLLDRRFQKMEESSAFPVGDCRQKRFI
jgi:hypothetical protein